MFKTATTFLQALPRHLCGLALVLCFLLAPSASAQTLEFYGAAYAGPDGLATLYSIDPNTGIATPIGPIGFERVGGMSFAPDGTLFAFGERADGSNTSVLITINTITGAGTEVGPTGLVLGSGGNLLGDMSFRNADGTLFLYRVDLPGLGDGALYTANTATGAASLVGLNLPPFIPSPGNGMAFNSADVLYHINLFSLNTLDQTTGAATFVVAPAFSPRINSMDFDPVNNLMYGILNDGSSGLGPNFLVTIDLTTGVVTSIGQTADGMDALAIFVDAVKPYVIVANSNVKFDGTERSDGDIHSNGDISFHDEEKGTHTGNLSARGDITIDEDVTIDGDAIAGDEVYEFGKITGSKADHENVDIIPLPTLNFTADGPDKTAPKKGSLTLSPGTYGKVKVEKKATLFLSSGDYFMDELDTDNLATVVIDVSAGPVNINVVKDLEIDDRVEIVIVPNGESDSELVTFSSMQKNKIDIGKYSRVLGTIIAPKAEVHFSDGSAFKGAICADKVTVEEEVPFFHHDSPHSLPKAAPVAETDEEVAGDQYTVDSYQLAQNYPNPFNPSTMINYQLPMSSVVKLSIYNLQGQLVRTLVSGEMPAGSHSVVWNATDDNGARVASGVYLYVIRADAFISQRKLVLMK